MKTKTRNILRSMISVLCILLMLYSPFQDLLKTYAESETIYVSDLKIYLVDTYMYDTVEKVAKQAAQDGYTLVPRNLNADSVNDPTYFRGLYLGYKTTTDPDDAITDIRTLGMDRDYYLYDYNSFMEHLKNVKSSTGNAMYRASQTFVENYNAGSPKAKDALEGLNLFYLDSAEMKLGDYILTGKADQDLFLEISVKASSGTVNAVLNFLNLGIAPYDSSGDDIRWASSMKDSPLRAKLAGGLKESERTAIAKQYDDAARDIFIQIQDFTTHFENAAMRQNYQMTGAIDTTVPTEEGEEVRNMEDAVEAMDDMEEKDGDPLYLATYEILNQYDYDETTKLGDWLLQIGHMNDEEIDNELLYPLIEAMGEVQTGLVRTMGFIAATSNLSKNVRSEDLANTLPQARDAIKDYNGNDCISVWDNADDDIEHSYIAYTSDAIRKSDGNNTIGKKTDSEKWDEKITNALKWIEIGSGAALVGAYILQQAFTLTASGLAYFAGSAACVSMSAVFSTMATAMAVVSTCLMWAGIALLAFSLIYAFCKWMAKQVQRFFPQMMHTTMPAYVFDAVDTADGVRTVKYKTIRRDSGILADVNDYDEQKWQILCYTKDKGVGSPLTMDDNKEIFVVNFGQSAGMLGYDCINFFGERSPANLNFYREHDNVHGIYVSYRTERSIQGAGPFSPDNEPTETVTGEVNYLADIIVAVASSGDEARAKIASKEGKYYILDYDLSPPDSNFTMIGYSMTTDPKQAITDIRIASYHGTDSVTFGEITYTYAGHLGLAKDEGDTSLTPTDALMKTKDPRAGSPIIADGLHPVANHSEAKPGWEPVTLFCGLPYNFSSAIETLQPYYTPLSGYWTNKSDNWSRTNCYLYYEPTEQYTQGENLYLAGLFCLNGYSIEKTFSYGYSQTKANMGQLKNQILTYPNAILFTENMAKTVQRGHEDEVEGHARQMEQYLGFTWTYNPKRAIYDITAYQGDSVMNSLSYNITRPLGDVTAGYAAVSAICQQNVDSSMDMKVSRFISPTNAIINDRALQDSLDDFSPGMNEGYIKTPPKGFAASWQKSDFLPMGLYVSGITTGKNPLTLGDVIIGSVKCDGVVKDGTIGYYVTDKALNGQSYNGETAFHSIYELKDPYATKALNIAYPQWYSKENATVNPTEMYIYIRGTTPAKPKYISSVSVGSYSREQYKTALSGQKTHVSDDEVKQIDGSVNATAMLGAVTSCSGETICVNLAAGPGQAWYERKDSKGKAEKNAPADVPAAYLGISRTDKATKAITAILLYQNDAKTAAATIRIEGAEYYCDSPGNPIMLDGKQYFLYYTRNRGVLTGARIQDIAVDDKPLVKGMATALCGKKGSSALYGEGSLPKFIHMSFEQEEGAYYTELFIGKGSSLKESQAELISKECYQFIDLDLNTAAEGSSLYLGYNTGYVDMANAKPTKIRLAWSEAIWDVIVTQNEPFHEDGFVCEKNGIYYAPVADVDLNDGVKAPAEEMYMYYCSPVVSEEYNEAKGEDTVMPEDYFSAPISRMGFARYDRVPSNSEQEGADGITPWEYVMLADHSAPADFNAGAIGFDSHGYFEDTRITMFLQRYDGSVKPSGKITGGFLYEYMFFSHCWIDEE